MSFGEEGNILLLQFLEFVSIIYLNWSDDKPINSYYTEQNAMSVLNTNIKGSHGKTKTENLLT